MIDGIINNGADSQEIAGTYDDVERAADEQARQEMSAATPEPTMPKISAEQALSELENTKRFNPDFYKSLPKGDRNVSQSLSMNSAKAVIAALAAQNIDFSAATRKNGMVAITTDKKDSAVLDSEIAKTQNIRQPEKRTQSVKREAAVHNESPDNARKIMQELKSQGIPCKSQNHSGKYGDYVTIAVPKEHENAYKQAETAVKSAKAEFINPDFYKQLPPQERFTQRMDEEQARQTVGELAKQGVEHSAVIDGKNSAVTVEKKDKPRFPFGINRGNVKKRIQTYQQEHKPDKAQEKQDRKNER